MKVKYNHNKFQDKGFTLLEILVALGIFSTVISAAVGIFVSSSGSQRKTLEFYDVQREGNYLMETVSRELRMATAICAVNTDPGCALPRLEMENKETDVLEFKNYEGEWIIYCRSLLNGACNSSGEYFSRNGEVINSSDIKIEDLTFYTSETFTNIQPVVTIVMKVKSTGKYGTELTLQNSIAMRLYE